MNQTEAPEMLCGAAIIKNVQYHVNGVYGRSGWVWADTNAGVIVIDSDTEIVWL